MKRGRRGAPSRARWKKGRQRRQNEAAARDRATVEAFNVLQQRMLGALSPAANRDGLKEGAGDGRPASISRILGEWLWEQLLAGKRRHGILVSPRVYLELWGECGGVGEPPPAFVFTSRENVTAIVGVHRG